MPFLLCITVVYFGLLLLLLRLFVLRTPTFQAVFRLADIPVTVPICLTVYVFTTANRVYDRSIEQQAMVYLTSTLFQ